MKRKTVIFALVSFCAVTSSASSEVFTSYESLATRMVNQLETGSKPSAGDFSQLLTLGYRIMDLYEIKYPECKAQYVQVRSEDAAMKTMKFDELNKKYHDGIGLVPAAKLCYQGRSMVAHPYMAIALIREGLEGANGELVEVARRALKLKTVLGF